MILEVKDVHAYYKDSHVLFGMDFGVDEGESVRLIGRNGAGKTTTLHAISGLLPAASGFPAPTALPTSTVTPMVRLVMIMVIIFKSWLPEATLGCS